VTIIRLGTTDLINNTKNNKENITGLTTNQVLNASVLDWPQSLLPPAIRWSGFSCARWNDTRTRKTAEQRHVCYHERSYHERLDAHKILIDHAIHPITLLNL